MNIYPTIEALLHYASTHLLFDELDVFYARNRILELLDLDDYQQYEINDEEVEGMETPDELVGTLSTYAISKNIISLQQQKSFERQILSYIIKKPSEIADLFCNLPAAKAFDWLYDYGKKSGFIRHPQKKWEAKATKHKIEVAFSGCDCQSCPRTENQKYPLCSYCLENQGYKDNLLMRSVPLELNKERMFFSYKKRPLIQNHGIITSQYHTPRVLDASAFTKMFEFISIMPNWIIAASESQHEHYVVSSRLTPLNKTPDRTRFKSKEYPYIKVSVIDWYFGVVRLLCTNRDKLIEYALKLIESWKKGGGREVAVCVRKKEFEYCIELMLLGKDNSLNTASNLTKCLDISTYMGLFSIGKKVEEQLKDIQKFVTKEQPFSPAKLVGDMAVHADMINRILLSVGNAKPTELEAELEIKDEVNKTLESALISLNQPIDEFYGNF